MGKENTAVAPVKGRLCSYSTKIIKAGALLADTKLLLAHWNPGTAVKENLERVKRENLFGKASRSRVEDILAMFRQRYLSDPNVIRALVALVGDRLPAASLDKILYFHTAKNDCLLRDVVTEMLMPMHSRGVSELDVNEFTSAVSKRGAGGRGASRWSDPTTHRVVRGLLATLRDFGVLQGVVNKRIAPTYLPISAFAYVAFFIKRQEASGDRLVESPDWKLFFLTRDGVERFLVEAQQHNLLEYHAAGRVTRLTFPTESPEEYAHVVARGSH
jgi:hypothetical protein